MSAGRHARPPLARYAAVVLRWFRRPTPTAPEHAPQSRPTPTNLVLYNLPGCFFCRRVEQHLKQLGLEYRQIDVPGPHRARTEVYELSGQYQVPVLVDDGHVIHDSARIIEYLNRTYAAV